MMKSNLLIGNHSVGTAPRAMVGARVPRARGRAGRATLPKIAAVLAMFAVAMFNANAADSLTMADFGHSIKLMVAGYTNETTLANFPVLVRISESGLPGFQYADMSAINNSGKTTGKDLAFFAEDGTRLASENDTWTHAGESLVWVKLPEMTQGTKFFMCYNVPAGVYVTNDTPFVEYVGVWHLKEEGGTSKAVIKNSTTNILLGITSSKGKPAVVTAGRIGAARRIATDTGNNPGYDSGITVALTNSSDLAAMNSLAPEFTASFWYYPEGDSSNWEYLMSRKNADGYNAWGLQFGDERIAEWGQIRIYGGNSGNYAVGSGLTFGSGTTKGVNIPDGGKNQWHKMDCVWTSDKKFSLYVDGALVAAGALSGNKAAVNGSLDLSIGGALAPASGKGGRGFKGVLDEARLRPGVVSADWVCADFDTVNNPSFVTVAPPDDLAITWVDESSAVGVAEVSHRSVSFAGTVWSLGQTASSCEIQYKVWATGASEPVNWETLTNGLTAFGAFEVTVSGLSVSTEYNYALRAVGNDEPASVTTPVTGTFTTGDGMTVVIAWSAASGTTGFSSVTYDVATVGGTVSVLGDATSCSVLGKYWADGDAEPSWTVYATGLALGDSFTHNITGLDAGTTYNYKLHAVGNDDSESVVVSGTFTTRGEQGETIGSNYTHLYDDGTNAFWVVNDFERYLPLTVTGYTGTEVLTNFPVLVDVRASDVDTNGFTYDDFYHYDGSDMAFVDEKGHIIPHEIDTWNKNGMSLIWVRLPEMVNGTKFTMCYRSPLIDPLPDVGNTFERYVGVWHMNETKNGVVDLKDSTVNNLVGETHAESLAGINAGQMIGGNCRRVAQMPGSSATYGRILVFNNDKDDLIKTGVGNVFTYSGWYKLAETPPKWGYLVSRKTMDQDVGWGIQCDESAVSKLRVWSGSSAKNKFQEFQTPNFKDDWHYWTFVFDGSVNLDGTTNGFFHAYMDGVELNSTVTNFTLAYPVVNDERAVYENLVIGGQQIGTGAFNGFVDEVRYSKGMRSPDWIKAEYLSTRQKDNAFVTKGTEIYRGIDSLVPVVVWERGAGLPDTILDVSYAYVQFAGTVTYCGLNATECRIEYQLWVDGEERPETWITLIDHVTAGRRFSIPVTGLKQDMPYNFRIRAVNVVNGHEQQNREHFGSFRTTGNVSMADVEGELIRLEDKFVHRFRAGTYNFYTPDYVTNVEILVVGGGGAGGYGIGGGGGGGGLFHSLSYPVTTNTHYKVQVGKGGIAPSNTTTTAANGNGEISYFALASDEEHPLIRMHGGGGGGSYVNKEANAKGADGASGGGGTYAFDGGSQAMLGLPEEFRPFGHIGGRGNDKLDGGNSVGKTAAGGGGGAGRAGTSASFDTWWSGGAGGVGVGNSMSGETLYYGAGGGGGYAYNTAVGKDGTVNFTKPGAGGSGIGGNAADIRNGTLATSGVPNTGAGGGGGSKRSSNEITPNEFWQGGNGGDGVVLISYEVHGRDPIAEEPRLSMTLCDYTDERSYADIGYRIYWAGVQTEMNDLYVLYSTSSSNEVANGEGTWVKAETSTIGIGDTTFTPPEVGYTYWVRLVARKDANSYMYSDEIASFFVPAIRNNGANWHMPIAESNQFDTAEIMYALYDMDPEAHLYLYWSENVDDVNGDTAPSGAGVHFLDLGTGRQSRDGTIHIPASEGFERNKTYYTRLATGNEAGTKYFLSPRTMELQTIDTPRVIFPEATWSNNVATVEFLETTSHLDPQTVDLVAYYGTLAEVFGDNGQVANMAKAISTNALSVNLGNCFLYPDDMLTTTQFPLWSPVDTNYYVRLALETNGVIVAVSQRYQSLDVITAVSTNTLLIYVNGTPHVSCYGDDPATSEYNVTFGGYTEGPGWDHWTNAMSIVGAPYCPVAKDSPSGSYEITQGTLTLSPNETYWHTVPMLNPETGEQMTDPNTGDLLTDKIPYYYMLCYTSSRHIVTNAIFSLSVEDISLPYTGDPIDTSSLVCTTNSEPRNSQPISYQYRVGTNEWTSTMPSGYTDVGSFIVQFKATAPSHDDVSGTFMVTVTPAPLTATIEDINLAYTGEAQTPVVVTNVTGLLHPERNTLFCSFRDEAGEWLDDVPSFTQPGTYKLFFRASATNHTTAVTNCTLVIRGWDFMINMDGATGYETPLIMGRPKWLIENSGMTGEQLAVDADRYAKLNETCANGLKLWQNYVLEWKDFSKKVIATIMQQGSVVNPNSFVVHFPNIEPLMGTGLKTQYRLDKKLRGNMTKSEFAEAPFTIGELTGKYETNIPLAYDGSDYDPTGLYVFNIVFSPTNETLTGQSVIASCATIGVLRVSSALTNTVTVAPWMSMSVDSTNKIEVAVTDVVNPFSIGAGDAIHAYETEDGTFRVWERKGDGKWNAPVTVNTSGVSQSKAEEATFAPGKAFWFVRNAPGPHIYLVGRYTGDDYEFNIEGGSTDVPGHTLVANPTFFDVALNDLAFVDGEGNSASPADGDRIVFQDIAGIQTIYSPHATTKKWGRIAPTKVGGRIKNVWTEDGTNTVGTGFWYYRTASETLKIKFEASR